MIYIGRKPCGCVVAAVLEDDTPAAVQDIGQMVVDGLTVTQEPGPVRFEQCTLHQSGVPAPELDGGAQ